MSNPKKKKNISAKMGLASSVFAILIGLIFGFIILLLSNPAQAVPGFITILTGALTHGIKGIGQVFYYATPIILTGLSVGSITGRCYYGSLLGIYTRHPKGDL